MTTWTPISKEFMVDESFSWDVILPQRAAGIGGPRPMGSVHTHSSTEGSEYISVPACVARKIAQMHKSGEFEPTGSSELREAIQRVCPHVAHDRVIRLLQRRDYSEAEVRERLSQEGFESAVIDGVVERARDSGLICNERFADAFIRGKVSAGWGMQRIERELSRRGVDVRTLEGWPYEYIDPDAEYERAFEVASRKRVREPNAYAKLMRFLLARGYSYGVASDAARKVLAS